MSQSSVAGGRRERERERERVGVYSIVVRMLDRTPPVTKVYSIVYCILESTWCPHKKLIVSLSDM